MIKRKGRRRGGGWKGRDGGKEMRWWEEGRGWWKTGHRPPVSDHWPKLRLYVDFL